MELVVLVDNIAGKSCRAEYGLSYVVYDDIDVIFDTGHSDLFLKNADILGCDINNIETVVLSHGHWDHGNGMNFIQNKKLICHPDVFVKRYRKIDNKYNGLSYSLNDIENKFDILLSSEPVELSENITYLGEIPRIMEFECSDTQYTLEDNNPDYIIDDSGIVVDTNKGLVIVTGCGHSGICNTIEYTRKISNNKRVYTVIGGFHLREVNDQLKKTIEYLKNSGIDTIYPSHCTSFEVQIELSKYLKINQVKTGDRILIE